MGAIESLSLAMGTAWTSGINLYATVAVLGIASRLEMIQLPHNLEVLSHPGVIAVGACNCHGKYPSYSGWGDALWCVFPSNDPRDPVGASMTYLTTAPVRSLLEGEAYYTTRFGFTSAATAVVAGICALIVSANPSLTSAEVKAVLRDSGEKIDVESNTYDERGHSPLYGYGRPDVARAVELARQR